jgi:hypothetical protein
MDVKSAFRTSYTRDEHVLMTQASIWLRERFGMLLSRPKVDVAAMDILFGQFLEMYSTHFLEEAEELASHHNSVMDMYEESKVLAFYNDVISEFGEVEFNPIQNG